MSLHKRLIPVIQIHDRRLIKTVRFNPKRYLGDPLNAVRIFNLKGVNELIILDIGATKTYKIDFSYLEKLASQAFIPLAYGGGISSIDDVHRLYKIGFDRIILGTTAIKNTQLIQEIIHIYGSQSIICSLDISKNFLGQYRATYLGGKNKVTTISLKEMVLQFTNLGAGEILLHDQTRDGTYKGLNIQLLKEISNCSTIPIIACGGTHCIKDAITALNSGASAVAIGSLFSFYGKYKAILINYPLE